MDSTNELIRAVTVNDGLTREKADRLIEKFYHMSDSERAALIMRACGESLRDAIERRVREGADGST